MEPKDAGRGGWGGVTRWLLALGVVALVAFFAFRSPVDSPPAGEIGGSDGLSSDGGPPLPRCVSPTGSGRPLHLGEPWRPVSTDGGAVQPGPLEPFAPELGEAAASAAGFAVGLKQVVGGRTMAQVLLLDAAGGDARTVSLGPVRGDMDAPLVRAAAGGWLVGMMEPDAGGYSLRLGGLIGTTLSWGSELSQGRDDSLAYDVAVSPTTVAVAWDEMNDAGDRGRIMLAVLSATRLRADRKPAVVSRATVDAEGPRLVARPGGFWLAYVASNPSALDPEPPPASGASAPSADGARYRGERIEPSWIELGAVDERGGVVAEPRAITPVVGHVLAFDVARGRADAAVVAWRDDDTPSGAHGGRVTTMAVTLAGSSEDQLVAEQDVGAGVPELSGGWLAVPDAQGQMRLGPVDPRGRLRGELRLEPAIGAGQVLVALEQRVLVARPAGRGVDLLLLRCAADAAGGVADGG